MNPRALEELVLVGSYYREKEWDLGTGYWSEGTSFL